MATMVANPDFNATQLAETLHAAMANAGTCEKDLIEVFAKHDNEQLQEVRTVYKGTYGVDLIEKVKGETSGNFGKTCVALLEDRFDYQADLLHGALAGLGTDDRTLNEVLGVMDAADIEIMKCCYEKKHGKELESAVKGDTSGNHQKMLVMILECNRPSGDDVDEEMAKEEAEKLFNAGEGELGTDEAYFRSLFLTRSWAQLKATLQAYNNLERFEWGDKEKGAKLSHDIETAIKKEFSGNSEALLLIIARFCLNRHEYFAKLLKDCLDGWGTQDDRLIHTVVRRCEIDLQDISEEFGRLYEVALYSSVYDDTSDDYAKLLLAVILGNKFGLDLAQNQ